MTLSLWTHCQAATMQPQAALPYGLIADAALVLDGPLLWGRAANCRPIWPAPAARSTKPVAHSSHRA